MKRPEWVWVICISFSVVAIISVQHSYQESNGAGAFNTQFYLDVILPAALMLGASALLFLRIAFNRWVWLAYLFLSLSLSLYSLASAESRLQIIQESTYVIIGALFLNFLSILLVALTTVYTFHLRGTGYYSNDTADQPLASTATQPALYRPFWLTILLLHYGFFQLMLLLGSIITYLQVDHKMVEGIIYLVMIAGTSAILLSVIGMWRLKKWGVLAGILGFLVFAAPIGYLGIMCEIGALLFLFYPSLLLIGVVYLWLDYKNSNFGIFSALIPLLTFFIAGMHYLHVKTQCESADTQVQELQK